MNDKINSKLKSMLNHDRYLHSVGVQQVAVELAAIYNEDMGKASVAGLLHDCAKDIPDKDMLETAVQNGIEVDWVLRENPNLLHGPVGSIMVRDEFNITDPDIIHSIRYHTTGCENMSMLDKIIYIADFIEPGRDFPGVDELRKAVNADIDAAVLMAMEKTIIYVIERKQLLDIMTVKARNTMMMEMQRRKYKGAD